MNFLLYIYRSHFESLCYFTLHSKIYVQGNYIYTISGNITLNSEDFLFKLNDIFMQFSFIMFSTLYFICQTRKEIYLFNSLKEMEFNVKKEKIYSTDIILYN